MQQLYLIGNPVSHSCSDVIHNTISEVLGLSYRYEILQKTEEQLEDFVTMVRVQGVRGFNVTIPHKRAIIPYLDEVDPAAQAIGAVNTVVNQDGFLTGYNTDAPGFLRALSKAGVSVCGKHVVVLGAGGAARGVCFALLEAGCDELLLVNRSREKAAALAADFERFGPVRAGEISDLNGAADLLVNTTSVGMKPLEGVSPVPSLSFVTCGGYVCDIIYNPFETALLTQAGRAGLAFQNGLYMLIYQGVIAYELWTGVAVPEAVVELVYQKLLHRFTGKDSGHTF